MGTTLTGTTPQDTYDSLIKVTDNGPLSGSLKTLTDGLGNDSALALSTGAASITGTLAVTAGTNLATASGNVGIGTASPTQKLSIAAAAALVDVTSTTGTNFNGLEFKNTGGSFYVGQDNSTGGFYGGGTAYAASLYNGGNTPMVFFTNAAERMRITSAGNVGIGTSAPECKLHVADGVSGGTVSLFVDNNINALNSTAQIKFTVDAGGTLTTGGAAIQAVNTDTNYANTDLVFRNSHFASGSLVEVFRLTDGARYLRMASGTGGIQFNGDTAAANALDDYEEGTWTMGISFGGGTTGVTYNLNTGAYTKVGNKVTVTGFLQLSSKGSSTGVAKITGLPFTLPANLNRLSAPSLWFNNITFANQFQGYCNQNSTEIHLYEITEAGAATALTNADFANNSEIMLSATYFV